MYEVWMPGKVIEHSEGEAPPAARGRPRSVQSVDALSGVQLIQK